jgi:ATP-dependent Lon protease
MPGNKKKQYNLRKKTKKAEPESSSSESDSELELESESESETESESEYKPSSPSNVSRSNESSYSEEEDNTVYTECVSEEEEEEKFDHKKFRKTIAKIFPSKFSKEKAKSRRPHSKEEESESSESEVETKKSRKSKKRPSSSSRKSSKKTKNEKKHRRRVIKDSESEDDDDEDDEDESEYDTADEEEKGKFIILSVGGGGLDEDYEEDECSEIESLTEDLAEDFNSDDEKTFMCESYVTEPLENKKKSKHQDKHKLDKDADKNANTDTDKDTDTDTEYKKGNKKSKTSRTTSNQSAKKEEDRNPIPDNVEDEYKEMIDVRKMLTEQLNRRPNNKFLKSSLKECNANIKKLTRKARHENTNAYYKLVNSDKRQTNEIDYFKHKLSNKEQQSIMTDLKEINRTIYAEKPYRLSILQSNIPSKFKLIAIQRLNTLKSMDQSDHEYYKIKNWVDSFMRIPYGIYRNINVRMSDGIEVCNDFMNSAKNTLDKCVYGLNDAKLQIMQMLGQWVVNPESVGTSIAIHGPPGTGKTSIVKDGISKILGREFAFIALGGCGDGSFLEGHSYTYEGSMWGKIVQILMDCKSMNPVIYFDELDKVSDSPRGQEIIGILTHLTDTTQNSEFHDKYFSEVSLDLSKCLFIFSYNDENAVNPILKDRMYRIQTKGYDTKEKIVIARDYLLPKIREQVSFGVGDVIIPDETLHYMISTPHLTKNEAGVRNLKRCLEIIHTKLNLYRLIKPGNAMFETDLGVNVRFPITVTRKEVDTFIKNNETLNPSILAMYV